MFFILLESKGVSKFIRIGLFVSVFCLSEIGLPHKEL